MNIPATRFDTSVAIGYSACMYLPIACTLTEAEMRDRRKAILDSVRGSALSVARLPEGYAFRFEPTSEALAQLARLVDLERQCCRFLAFKIVVEPGTEPICLEITGPPEAQAFIADCFGT